MHISLTIVLNVAAIIVVGMSWAGIFHVVVNYSMSSELLVLGVGSHQRIRNMQAHIESELNATVETVATLSAAILSAAPPWQQAPPYSAAASSSSAAATTVDAVSGAMMQLVGRSGTSMREGRSFLVPALMCRFNDGAAVVARRASAGSNVAVVQVHQSQAGVYGSASNSMMEDFSSTSAKLHRRVVNFTSLTSVASSSAAALPLSAAAPLGATLPLAPPMSTFLHGSLWNASASLSAATQSQLSPPGAASVLFTFRASDEKSIFYDGARAAASSTSTAAAEASAKLILPVVSHSLPSSQQHYATCTAFLDVQRDLTTLLSQHLLHGEGSRALVVDGHGRVLADTAGAVFDIVDSAAAMDKLLQEEAAADEKMRAAGQVHSPLHLPLEQRCFAADDDAQHHHACLHDVSSFHRYDVLRAIDGQLPLSEARDTTSPDANSRDVVRRATILGDGSSGETATVDKDTYVYAITLHRNFNSSNNNNNSNNTSGGGLRVYLFVPVGFFVNPIMTAVDIALGVSVALFVVAVGTLVVCVSVVAGMVENLVDNMSDPWGVNSQRTGSSSDTTSSSGGRKGTTMTILPDSGFSATASQQHTPPTSASSINLSTNVGSSPVGGSSSADAPPPRPPPPSRAAAVAAGSGSTEATNTLATSRSSSGANCCTAFFRGLSKRLSDAVQFEELHELEEEHALLMGTITKLRGFMNIGNQRQAKHVIHGRGGAARASAGTFDSSGGTVDVADHARRGSAAVLPHDSPASSSAGGGGGGGGGSSSSLKRKSTVRFAEQRTETQHDVVLPPEAAASLMMGLVALPPRRDPSQIFCAMSFNFSFAQELAWALQKTQGGGASTTTANQQQQQQQVESHKDDDSLLSLVAATSAVATFSKTILNGPITVIEFLGDGLVACVRLRDYKDSRRGAAAAASVTATDDTDAGGGGGGGGGAAPPRRSKLMERLLASIFTEARKLRETVTPILQKALGEEGSYDHVSAIAPAAVFVGLCVGKLRAVDTGGSSVSSSGGSSSRRQLFRPNTFFGSPISTACAISRLLSSAACVSSSKVLLTEPTESSSSTAASVTQVATRQQQTSSSSSSPSSRSFVPLYRYHNVGVMSKDDARWITQRGERTGCVVAVNASGVSTVQPTLMARPAGFVDLGQRKTTPLAEMSSASVDSSGGPSWGSSSSSGSGSGGSIRRSQRQLARVLCIYNSRETATAVAEQPKPRPSAVTEDNMSETESEDDENKMW